jgi:hypothetical protein
MSVTLLVLILGTIMTVFGFVRMWYNPGQQPVLSVFLLLVVGGAILLTIWSTRSNREKSLPDDSDCYDDHGRPVLP